MDTYGRWTHIHPDLRIIRLTELADRMRARCRLLMSRRRPHALCMAERQTRIELMAEELAMRMGGPYRDAA